MCPSLLTIPTEDRILLYLSDFKSLDNVYEAPTDVTQKEIARGVRIQRKHISRYLKKLVENELIIEKRCHVKGAKQRMKCYFLSESGARKGYEIRKYVGNMKVKILIEEEIKDMLVSDIDGSTSVHLTLSDIVSEAIDADEYLDRDHLEQIEERKRRQADESSRKADIYRKALLTAWRNGVLTPSEKHLTEALKEHLSVTDDEHNNIESEIINNMILTQADQVGIFEAILNEIGEKPTNREKKIINILKDRFQL